MSTFDLFLLLPVAYGAFKGFFKGLVLEIASLASLIILTVFGMKIVGLLTPPIHEWLGDKAGFLPFLPYLVVFIGIGFAVRAIGMVIKKAVHLTPLGLMDNVIGALVGAAKWGFAICLLVYFANATGLDVTLQTVRKSEVYPYYLDAAPNAWAFVQWIIPFGRKALESFA
ncbi:CvpA family protein [Rufibacter latericius]|uniref:CvpA family protein n=1 Tax=Rufibacter latericius TaxID=2487040 RepID=A0A3M9MSX0_9BACT|nr:CvpA family protein [Rufibacter latericius]RNI28601.1 CvpA family protein [Rufibacter latericius]